MTTIDPLRQIIERIRSEKTTKTKATTTKSRTANNANSAASKQQNVGTLQENIRHFLQHVDLSNDLGRKQARKYFLQTVIANELGDSLSNEAQFNQLINEVEKAIANDKEISKELDDLLKSL